MDSVCAECEHFLGLGDWNLCCDIKCDLVYSCTSACSSFESKTIKQEENYEKH